MCLSNEIYIINLIPVMWIYSINTPDPKVNLIKTSEGFYTIIKKRI